MAVSLGSNSSVTRRSARSSGSSFLVRCTLCSQHCRALTAIAGYLFTALSVFSFICWAKPQDVVVNQLFGVSSGLGMSILTFDWSQITWIGSPLMVPWWAEVQIFSGFFLIYWILCPILYYTNVSPSRLSLPRLVFPEVN